jgi:class 3 adenylate cyclase
MKCARCQHQNREQATFCAGCGAPLAKSCASCGATLESGAKFCDACGRPAAPLPGAEVYGPRTHAPAHLVERILGARRALEGERKLVTVLFADVKGSLDLAAHLDAEDWHRIMDRFYGILAEGVHRFEGTVNQFTGDGIMALFGAPVAHEDHARRACSAGLHLAEALRRYAGELRRGRGLNFSVRMGLNSGEVVVGRIGDDLRMQCTAHGQTVGLASRMEQLAEPGRIYVSENTAMLVRGLFRLRDLGEFSVKGIEAPLRIHELEGMGPLRTRLDISGARGFSRFVGREEEAASLEAALTRALGGNGQVVGVMGEPGVGKSRLCHEFAQRCVARGVAVYAAHGIAHGKMVPLAPVLEYLRSYFGVAGEDAPQAAREKVAGKVLLLDPELFDALPLLFDLLGVSDPDRPVVPQDPQEQRTGLFAALRRLLHAQSRQEPGLSLIEDLHWLDEESEAFIENFVEAVAGTRMLLVVNFRPGYQAGWMQRACYHQLPLPPLGPHAIAEMLRELLGTDPSVAEVADGIRDRAAGNPFFIEEMVQSLVELKKLLGVKGAYRLGDGDVAPALPATVQAVLAGRIDRLAEQEKRVLQTAAVIGKDFSEPVLRAVVALPEAELAGSLRLLLQGEFLHTTALHPDAEYAFKHPLTQEVAYHSQLGDGRAQLHSAVATAVRELHAERLGEFASLIAHHCEAAGMRGEASRWRRRAALKVSSIRVGGWRRNRDAQR